EIRAERLADDALLPIEVEDVVGDLERDPDLGAEPREDLALLAPAAGVVPAEAARRAVEQRRLLGDHLEVARLAPVEVEAVQDLGDLALTDAAHDVAEHAAAGRVVELHRHVERARVEVVAE